MKSVIVVSDVPMIHDKEIVSLMMTVSSVRDPVHKISDHVKHKSKMDVRRYVNTIFVVMVWLIRIMMAL